MIQRRTLQLSAALLTLSLASACSVLPEAEPITFYNLPSPQLAPSQTQPLQLSLRIITPDASYALQAPRIMVSPDENTVNSYQGARWTDPNPALLREHLIQAFQQDGSFRTVSNDTQALEADVHLYSDLRQFQTVYRNGNPEIAITMDAKLVDPATRQVISGKHFQVTRQLDSPQVPAVVEGLGQASDELAGELISWSRQALADMNATQVAQPN
ncbi:MAG: ABC-type transport auxiliary lipoprotein family protein [Halopseudomonas sp.]|uniref:ABC-type transport auxiliary lipoprotein family protein n=1 Tax=Halopseudomonas sp. TaxID=2901191 RepID=UPI0030015482